jgi:phage tail-like protein
MEGSSVVRVDTMDGTPGGKMVAAAGRGEERTRPAALRYDEFAKGEARGRLADVIVTGVAALDLSDAFARQAMAKLSGTSRADPYRNFNFRVTISGRLSAGFSEVTGLQAAVPEAKQRPTGAATTARKIPGLHKAANVTLKRGIMAAAGFSDPIKARDTAEPGRSDVVIEQYDAAGRKIASFALAQCHVLEVAGRLSRAKSAKVVKVVTLKLRCEGVRRKLTSARRTKRPSK